MKDDHPINKDLEKVKRLDWSRVCKEHDNLSQVLEYADSTKEEIRAAAVSTCLALNGLHEQLRKAAHEIDKHEHVAWVHYTRSSIETCDSDAEGAFKVFRRSQSEMTLDRRDLLECESIISSVVDFVNVWSREAALPEIQSAGQITKALDKLWSRASFRDVTMQSALSSIAANSCCKPCQEAGRVATDGLRAASAGELLWIERKPEFDPSKYDAQGNAKASAETPHTGIKGLRQIEGQEL